MTKTEEIDISNLHAECIDVKPVNCDWEALSGPDGDGYTAYEAVEGDTSGRVYIARASEGDDEAQSLQSFEPIEDDEPYMEYAQRILEGVPPRTDDFDEVSEAIADAIAEEHVGLAEGPMMRYFPLPDDVGRYGFDPEQAAYALQHLPLCVVEFSDESQDKGTPEYALALTGGGQDLSWEICEAFMQIGQLPPIHFCDLPGMAGRADPGYGNFKRDSAIIAACRRSIEIQSQRLERVRTSLLQLAPVAVVGQKGDS